MVAKLREKEKKKNNKQLLYVLPQNADAMRVFWLAPLPQELGFGCMIYKPIMPSEIESCARALNVRYTEDLLFRVAIMCAEVIPSLNREVNRK